MKAKIQQFLFGKNHSWAVCGKEIGRQLIKKGHDVDLVSTDGVIDKYITDDLRQNIKNEPSGVYDLQISYTAMFNFPKYLSSGSKNRFGIWNYEFTKLPDGFAKHVSSIDYLLPTSNFSKDIFISNGVPESKIKVIPHGADLERFKIAEPYKLKTNKKYKILANIAQPHIRKNVPGLLEAFGKAFNKNDDVCLVLKVVDKKPSMAFEVSFSKLYSEFNKKYKDHAECEIIRDYIPNIEGLYKATDIVFTMTNAECWWLPGLEGLAANNIIISPRYGGQLDYLNDDNSLLIEGKLIRAPKEAQYWTSSVYSAMFQPSIDDAVEKLRYCISNYDILKSKLLANVDEKTFSRFTWDNVVNEIIKLCE